jgi:hypothetical protein
MLQTVAKALLSTLVKIVVAGASEKFMAWLLFRVAEEIASSTKSPLDDEFIAQLKASYYKKSEG